MSSILTALVIVLATLALIWFFVKRGPVPKFEIMANRSKGFANIRKLAGYAPLDNGDIQPREDRYS